MVMSAIEKVTVSLTPDLAAFVRQAVENGDYASMSEVVRDALREWKLKRSFRQQQLEELGRLWDEGIKSGPGLFANIDAVMQEARRRFNADGDEGRTRRNGGGGLCRLASKPVGSA